MSKKCSVFDCENYKTSSNAKMGFFAFPKDEKLKSKWIKFCGHGDDFSPSSHDIVCVDHFVPEDFQNSRQFEMGLSDRLRLKLNAFPTIPTKSSTAMEEEERKKKLEYKKIVDQLLKEHTDSNSERSSTKREDRHKKLEYKKIVDQLLKEHEESNSKASQEIRRGRRTRNNFVHDPLDAKEIVLLKLPKKERKLELEENPLEGCEKYEENSLNELNDASENDLAMEDEMEIFDNDDTNLEGELEKLNIDIDLEAELERLHNDQNVENELEKLRNENCEEPIDERLQREMYLESEVERLQKEVESLRSENLRLQTAETKYLKTLAAVKKKYMTTLETAHRKYLESEEQYLCEINTLKQRLENIDYENNCVENELYEIQNEI